MWEMARETPTRYSKQRAAEALRLGADYALDAASGRHRAARILEGQTWVESRRSPLVDGGYVTRPDFGSYGPEGRWVIEGHGVDPDIEVDNRDDRVAQGRDPQLEWAIDYFLEEIGKKPPALPPVPPPPVKK